MNIHRSFYWLWQCADTRRRSSACVLMRTHGRNVYTQHVCSNRAQSDYALFTRLHYKNNAAINKRYRNAWNR